MTSLNGLSAKFCRHYAFVRNKVIWFSATEQKIFDVINQFNKNKKTLYHYDGIMANPASVKITSWGAVEVYVLKCLMVRIQLEFYKKTYTIEG